MFAILPGVPPAQPRIEVVGAWQVRVTPGVFVVGRKRAVVRKEALLTVSPAALVRIRDEQYDGLPLFDPAGAPWARGAALRAVRTYETTQPDILVPGSLVVKSGTGAAPPFRIDRDYAVEPRWATFGRLPDGAIVDGQRVWVDYDAGWNRLDTILVARDGTVRLAEGRPHAATPVAPRPGVGETAIAHVWVPGRLERLTSDNLYPIVEPTYPVRRRTGPPPAARLLPRTWAKLRSGRPVHVLAWGDSVTAGGQASDEAHRWQNRFVALLQQRFPKAQIRLTTVGWGGRNSDSFLQEPPGAEYNFDRAVIQPKPDLVVMEFVNDAWMTPEVVEGKYSYLLRRFRDAGIEWAILTPHYVRPDWMGAKSDRIEEDPRPYVAGLRAFAAKHGVALADASLRWGHLVKEGIPYVTLESNSINHPDDRGHEMFAQALMELF